MLVHQWAKYRWGIYDEHPTSPSQLYSFYSNGRFEATRCTSRIRGDVVHVDYRVSCHPTTANDECGFRPSVTDNAEASVMFYQQMDTVKLAVADLALQLNGVPFRSGSFVAVARHTLIMMKRLTTRMRCATTPAHGMSYPGTSTSIPVLTRQDPQFEPGQLSESFNRRRTSRLC